MAAESVLTVVSARAGVLVGALKANKIAVKNNKARAFFVSQMAAENADFDKTLEGLKSEFGGAVCPIVYPVVKEGQPTVYVDLLEMKGYTYANGVASEVAVPDTNGKLEEIIGEMNEAIAETDEALMDKFFADEPFSHDELISGLRTGILNDQIAPVVCGDALTLEGLDKLLKLITTMMPAPTDAKVEVMNGETAEVISCDANAPLVAYVFKTVADPFVGKLSYVKVLSGTFKAESAVIIARTGEPERLGKLISVKGKKQTDVKEIGAGDIGAVTKLAETKTGDTLCTVEKNVAVKSIVFPLPSMSMAVTPKKKGDESKISGSIQRLLDEDPTLSYSINGETGQQLLAGLGEQHLDVIVSKLKTKFGVEVDLVAPRIAYRETIRKKVKVQGRHKKQSGGHGQFGDVWIEFEPCDGDDLVFEENVFGGAVPKNFFPAVEKGLRECVTHGVLAGYPVVGLKATLVDGSYHPVDSSEMAFKTAASLAYKAGLAIAGPTLLEPIANVKALVPDTNTGDIMGEITKRRGRVLGMHADEDGLQLVEAEVPMGEMSDFTTYIRSSTQGRGSFTMEFERYEPLPGNLEAKVIEEAKALQAEEDK